MKSVCDEIFDHYINAVSEHPYFADLWTESDNAFFEDLSRENEKNVRILSEHGELTVRLVLDKEISDFFAALTRGDMAGARDKVLDTIAVLMRMIDVIDGLERFGCPAKDEPRSNDGRSCSNYDCRDNDRDGSCSRKEGMCRCGNCTGWAKCWASKKRGGAS